MVYRRRIRRRFTRRIRRRPYGRNRTSFRKKVRRTLLQAAEQKQASSNFDLGLSNFYKTSFAPVTIPQGPGDNQRIGNAIMARNWQLKVNFQANTVQNPAGDGNGLYQMRFLIVWARKLSVNDAISAIGLTAFPLTSMIDQDNWIVWYDKTFNFAFNGTIHPNVRQYHRIVFNKKFFCKLEFANAAATIPTKLPYIIIVTNHPTGAFEWRIQGYCKLSYKDI